MITDINGEDRLVQTTFAEYLHDRLGWETAYAWQEETFGPGGTLGRADEREVVLVRDLTAAVRRLNPGLPGEACDEAIRIMTRVDMSRSTIAHNQEFYGYIRDGVPVNVRDDQGRSAVIRVRMIDFRNADNNRFLAVRELKIQGLRVPHYNRRADLICYVNGLPLVFFELKAVYLNIRAGFDGNISDYTDTISHVFHHNAFLVVSNGDRARYGSITSAWEHFAEWKRNEEDVPGNLGAVTLLDGMLARERLLDIVENFVLFDSGKAGGIRKIIGRNHQILGVNRAVASVIRQEALKKDIPPDRRLQYRLASGDSYPGGALPIVERAHPDLGRLGVFWHTQGSGKSYSMIFFAEKVKRRVSGSFTFLIMTDREDLDDQIFRTFSGCGIVGKATPRAASGEDLRDMLQENHRYIFSLIHKFNREVSLEEPYSRRDDIIVISDESHRTQAGKFARKMRLALPNAAFIGFTGTPLFKYDHLTRRIFGEYISRYDFKRSEEDGATVRLVYENRGEKLGLSRLDLNDRIAEKIEEADLDQDQEAHLEKLLGKDYEVITASERLERIADDFVGHLSRRWESGKAMLVCIDKPTCGRMHQLILPRWQARLTEMEAELERLESDLEASADEVGKNSLLEKIHRLRASADWMRETRFALIVSEEQNEIKRFQEWGVDIRPHRDLMKRGFATPDGRQVDVETAFKDPQHPFRVAIVCAMWLTGFDVESLTTLYIDKPMKAHTLMQAIARANRVYPGKECGVIVDYNGMLKSLREALSVYALGDDSTLGGLQEPGGSNDVVTPIEELLRMLVEAIDAAENHLDTHGFTVKRLDGSKGFDRIAALKDAVEVLYASDETKRRFEILARVVFSRFKALIAEPAIHPFSERHDNIEAIYKKLQERREHSDVTGILKRLHEIVNEAIRTQETGDDQKDGRTYDLSKIDLERLREEFDKRVKRKNTVCQDLCKLVEARLERMLARNPGRMDYYKKYQEIIAEYNREKDRVTIEEIFYKLQNITKNLDDEERRAVREGLSEAELALFDLLMKGNLSKTDREKVKQAGRKLYASLRGLLEPMDRWWEKEQTQAEAKAFILDWVFETFPDPVLTENDKMGTAEMIFDYVWQQCAAGGFFDSPEAA